MNNIEELVQAFIRASAIIQADAKLTAPGGTLIIDTTAPTACYGTELMAQSATVISACTGINLVTKLAVDFKATYNWVTLSAGIPIIAPNNFRITSITLTSGSVAVYS